MSIGLAVKRAGDIAVSLCALILLAPLLALLGALVRWRLGSPVFFSQLRPGKDARPFRLYKFRSMSDARDGAGELLPDGARLTALGKFLRSSSLDELPELWNILRGDMSVVGPRPLLMDYVPLYDEQQRRRMRFRPGLTGLAQVSGRNALTWNEKFAYDTRYVDNWSLILDIRIMLQTAAAVLLRRGISAAGEATMPRFTGNSRVGTRSGEPAPCDAPGDQADSVTPC